MSQVRGFKLTSGEEIICQIHQQTENTGTYKVEHPFLVEWEIHPNMAPCYDLLPWAFSLKVGQPMNIPVFSVCAGPYMVRSDMERQYRELYEKVVQSQETVEEARRQNSMMEPRRVSRRKR